MTVQHRTITLSTDQIQLLELLVSAATEEPEAPFGSGGLRRVGFTWIIHDGFYQGVGVANWDDLLVLDEYDVLDLHVAEDDPNDCSFVLTSLARQVHNQWQLMHLSHKGAMHSIDVVISSP